MRTWKEWPALIEGGKVIIDINLPFHYLDGGSFDRRLVFVERSDGSVDLAAEHYAEPGLFSVGRLFGSETPRREVAEFVIEITAASLVWDYTGTGHPEADEELAAALVTRRAKNILRNVKQSINKDSDYWFGQPYWEDYFEDVM